MLVDQNISQGIEFCFLFVSWNRYGRCSCEWNSLHLINFLCSCRVQFRVSEHQEQNKMGQNNLATVFGPNILRPSSSSSADPTDLAQGTLDVMMQVSIFLWFLKCSSVQLPSDPNLLHRLAPRKPPEIVIAPDLTEEQPDRLIWHDISRSIAMSSLVFGHKPYSLREVACVLTRLFIRMPRCYVTLPSILRFGFDIIAGSCINLYQSALLSQHRDHNNCLHKYRRYFEGHHFLCKEILLLLNVSFVIEILWFNSESWIRECISYLVHPFLIYVFFTHVKFIGTIIDYTRVRCSSKKSGPFALTIWENYFNNRFFRGGRRLEGV